MKTQLKLVTALLALACSPAFSQAPVDLGRLECVSSGIQNRVFKTKIEFDCEFIRIGARTENYVASVTRAGLDLSVKREVLIIWSVTLAGNAQQPESLAGTYFGAGAEVSAVAGAGLRALVGGSQDAVTLSPTSFTGVTGAGVSLGVERFVLSPAS